MQYTRSFQVQNPGNRSSHDLEQTHREPCVLSPSSQESTNTQYPIGSTDRDYRPHIDIYGGSAANAAQSPARPCAASHTTSSVFNCEGSKRNQPFLQAASSHCEASPNTMPDGFDPRQNIHPVLLDGFTVSHDDSIEENLPIPTMLVSRASDQGMSNTLNRLEEDAQNRHFYVQSPDAANSPEAVYSQPHFQSLLVY